MDFMDQFEDPRRLGDTSENSSEARESSCVIILKSFCPHALGSWHFSMIDDSRCARAFSTTAPVRNITSADELGGFNGLFTDYWTMKCVILGYIVPVALWQTWQLSKLREE